VSNLSIVIWLQRTDSHRQQVNLAQLSLSQCSCVLSRNTFQQLRDCAITTTKHLPHSPSADDSSCTDACSLILLTLDYCNAVLHGTPSGNIQKLQHVQNSAAQIILQGELTPTHSIPAALAVSSTSNHVQVGGTDVQGGPQHIWVVTSSYMTACRLYARPRPLDFLNCSPVQHLPSVCFAVLVRPPGTLCQEQLLTTTH